MICQPTDALPNGRRRVLHPPCPPFVRGGRGGIETTCTHCGCPSSSGTASRMRLLMARTSKPDTLPACYAVVLPGLEGIAADEISRDLSGTVKKKENGLVVLRVTGSLEV